MPGVQVLSTTQRVTCNGVRKVEVCEVWYTEYVRIISHCTPAASKAALLSSAKLPARITTEVTCDNIGVLATPAEACHQSLIASIQVMLPSLTNGIRQICYALSRPHGGSTAM